MVKIQALSAVVAIALFGCSPHPLGYDWPNPVPLGRDVPVYTPPRELDRQADPVPRPFEEPREQLTLREAMVAALLNNPELASFSWEVRIREARALKAGLLPNPEVGLEVEEIGGTGVASGFDAAATTVLFSQLIPLAGKIEKQARVAELDRDLAGWDYEAKRIEVFTDVTTRFVAVAVAQRHLQLAHENVALAEQIFEAATKRLQAGIATTIDQTKANVVVATTRIESKHAEHELTTARHRLAATWGSTNPLFESVAAELQKIEAIPSYAQLMVNVSQNPGLARWTVEIAQRKAELKLARAQAVPDVTAGAGVRYLNESNDTVYLMEFSLPIPLFDRNQGGILEASYATAKAKQERRAAEVRVRTLLAQTYQTLAAVYDEVRSLKDHVVPAARQAFDATNKAYQAGKIGYLEVLDAQRTLIETKAQYVGALGGYHAAVAELEGLIGQPLNDLADNQSDEDSSENGDINEIAED